MYRGGATRCANPITPEKNKNPENEEIQHKKDILMQTTKSWESYFSDQKRNTNIPQNFDDYFPSKHTT